jgi:hypothetical protein
MEPAGVGGAEDSLPAAVQVRSTPKISLKVGRWSGSHSVQLWTSACRRRRITLLRRWLRISMLR